jgi:hypothetical protein
MQAAVWVELPGDYAPKLCSCCNLPLILLDSWQIAIVPCQNPMFCSAEPDYGCTQSTFCYMPLAV